jgi:hypothetical protein
MARPRFFEIKPGVDLKPYNPEFIQALDEIGQSYPSFVEESGMDYLGPLRITSGAEESSRHVPGSLHYEGAALDIAGPVPGKPVSRKTRKWLEQQFRQRGLRYRDEWQSPPGDTPWSAPHAHVEMLPGRKPQMVSFSDAPGPRHSDSRMFGDSAAAASGLPDPARTIFEKHVAEQSVRGVPLAATVADLPYIPDDVMPPGNDVRDELLPTYDPGPMGPVSSEPLMPSYRPAPKTTLIGEQDRMEHLGDIDAILPEPVEPGFRSMERRNTLPQDVWSFPASNDFEGYLPQPTTHWKPPDEIPASNDFEGYLPQPTTHWKPPDEIPEPFIGARRSPPDSPERIQAARDALRYHMKSMDPEGFLSDLERERLRGEMMKWFEEPAPPRRGVEIARALSKAALAGGAAAGIEPFQRGHAIANEADAMRRQDEAVAREAARARYTQAMQLFEADEQARLRSLGFGWPDTVEVGGQVLPAESSLARAYMGEMFRDQLERQKTKAEIENLKASTGAQLGKTKYWESRLDSVENKLKSVGLDPIKYMDDALREVQRNQDQYGMGPEEALDRAVERILELHRRLGGPSAFGDIGAAVKAASPTARNPRTIAPSRK